MQVVQVFEAIALTYFRLLLNVFGVFCFHCIARPTLLTVSTMPMLYVVGMQHNFSLLQFCLCLIIRLRRYMQEFRFNVPCAWHASHTHTYMWSQFVFNAIIYCIMHFIKDFFLDFFFLHRQCWLAVRRAKVQSKLCCHWRLPLIRSIWIGTTSVSTLTTI